MIQVTTYPHRHATPFGFFWRSILASAGYTLALVLGGMVTAALHLPALDLPGRPEPAQLLAAIFGSGILMSLVVGSLATRLAVPQPARLGILFSLLLILNSVLNVLESLFFTTMSRQGQLAGIVTQGIAYLGLAALLAWLFPANEPPRSLQSALRNVWQARSNLSWLGRFVLAGLLFIPIYWLFGNLVIPIILPYYNNPALGLGLVVPEPGVILALEAVRGLLFVLAVFPVVLLWRGSRLSLGLWLGLPIAVLVGIAPLLQGTFLPPVLRVVHGLEITADSFVHGMLIAWLLGVSTGRKG